jgi:flagellar basal body-associated protein FliL
VCSHSTLLSLLLLLLLLLLLVTLSFIVLLLIAKATTSATTTAVMRQLQEAGIYQTPVEQQARHLETELARDALKHKLEAADRPTAEELTAQGILYSKQHDLERLLAAAQVGDSPLHCSSRCRVSAYC